MAKVSLGRYAKQNEKIKNTFKAVASQYSIPGFCKIMGFSKTVLYSRRNNPEKTTIEELRNLMRISDISDPELLRMIRDDRDARPN